MKDQAYIILNSKGISRMIRKSRPKLAKGEYAVRLELTVPDHVFMERPLAVAMVEVNAEKLLAPSVEIDQLDPPPEPPPAPHLHRIEDDPEYKKGLAGGDNE